MARKKHRPTPLCPCGSGKAPYDCCGESSSQIKLRLERSARGFAEAGMHTEAAEALQERVRLSPRNPMIWNDLGVQLAAAGQIEAAREAFLQAHQVFPEYPVALYNLGRLLILQCEEEEAKRFSSAERARELKIEAIRYLQACLKQDALLRPAQQLLAATHEGLDDPLQERVDAQHSPQGESRPNRTSFLDWLRRIPFRRGKSASRDLSPFLSSTDHWSATEDV